MDKEETKLVYTYDDAGKYTGTKTLDYTDRSPISGAWQIPAGCTETAPYIEPKDGYDIIWNGTAWEYKKIKQEKNIPEQTIEEIQAEKLNELDMEYYQKLYDNSQSIIFFTIIEKNEEYAEQLRQERQALQDEYVQKRSEL